MMKIAQVAPLYEAVPPGLYGGTERVVYHLTEELVRRGHEVTLFATGDSRTSAKLVATRPRALRLDKGPTWDVPAIFHQMEVVREAADDFDIIHFHCEVWPGPFFEDLSYKTLTTIHGRQDLDDLKPYFERYDEFPLVSISDAQRRPFPYLDWQATIYHGYPMDLYRFTSVPRDGYLAFLGRIAPEKGVDRAIAIAKRAGLPIRIAAKVDKADRSYFEQDILPLLDDPAVTFIGEIGDGEKSDFLGNAAALLVPIDWPEPFGLVMIEAMACGTPVIAFNAGSVPEVVTDGVDGFVVESIEEAAAAVARLSDIDRLDVRRSFERRFTVEVMGENYERVYRRLAARIGTLRKRPVLADRLKPAAPAILANRSASVRPLS